MMSRTGKQASANLYRFIRLHLGAEVSDREIARRWNMHWRSFLLLKNGQRLPPRVDELVALAKLLNVDPTVVFEVSRGTPAGRVHKLLSDRNPSKVCQAFLPKLFRHCEKEKPA